MADLPPVGSVYDEVLGGYFGAQGTDVLMERYDQDTMTLVQDVAIDDTYRSELWRNFLTTHGFDPDGPFSQITSLPDAEREALKIEFVKYINARLIELQTQELNLASLDETKKREIMFRTFEILLKMLVALQNTVGVIGNNLIFFGKWQEQYTNMLTRVPIYTGGTSSFVKPTDLTVANPDFSGFTLGYNNISLEDIGDWYAAKVRAGETGTFYISSDATKAIDVTGQDIQTRTALKIVVDPNATFTGSISLVQELIRRNDDPDSPLVFDSNGDIVELGRYDIGPDGLNDLSSTPDETIRQLSDTIQFRIPPASASADDPAALAALFKKAFQEFYNALPAQSYLEGWATPSASDNLVHIPTLYTRDETGALVELGGFPGSDHFRGLNRIPVFIKDPSNDANNLPAWRVLAVVNEAGDFDLTLGPNNDGIIGTVNVPWQHTFNVTEGPGADKDLADQEAKTRAEINARNQQFIENIRSRRQVVQNNAKQIESSLSQAKESISEMANLLTSILDSLKGLIGSIFR